MHASNAYLYVRTSNPDRLMRSHPQSQEAPRSDYLLVYAQASELAAHE